MRNWQKNGKERNAMDTVRVYTALTGGIDGELLKRAVNKLPLWRKRYIEKKTPRETLNSAFAYLLLAYLTEKEFGGFDPSPFTYGENGKPYFAESELYFSISHCRTAVGAAASRTEIGLDLMDSRRINEGIARIICTEEELRQFEASESRQDFLRLLWCKKESAVKKTGTGFTAGFKTVKTEDMYFKLHTAPSYLASVYGGGEAEFKEIDPIKLIEYIDFIDFSAKRLDRSVKDTI